MTTFGISELESPLITREKFVDEFISGSLTDLTVDFDLIDSLVSVRDEHVENLVDVINGLKDAYQNQKALEGLQTTYIKLLQEADAHADQLSIVAKKEKDVFKKEVILNQLKSSNQYTYISNLQAFVLENDLQSKDNFFKQAEKISLDFLKKIVKSSTKWVGTFRYVLDLNRYGISANVSLDDIKEMIAATMLVFDDPVCEFESNGSFTNNKAKIMSLSEFLLEYLQVDQATMLNFLNQSSGDEKIRNLHELASSITV